MDKQKEKVLADYIKFRQLRNHSRTIGDISFHIKTFLEYSKKSIDFFDEDVLVSYITSIKEKYSVIMLNNIKSSYIKNFIKWYFIDWSSRFRHLDTICRTEKAISSYQSSDMLSEVDFKKMIQFEESIFWKAYYLTLFYGGCRPIEVCSLKWKNVEFDKEGGAFITIFSNKNKSNFIKYLPSDVAFYLKKLNKSLSDYVFFNEQTKLPISVKGAYRHIIYLSQASLFKRVDLYTLRHSIATIIYNKDDMKDSEIAQQMGHTKSMKEKYVHNNLDRVKAIAKRIYVSPEELPPEQIPSLIKRIEILEDLVQKFVKVYKK